MATKKPMNKNPAGNNDFKTTRSFAAGFRALSGEGNERSYELSFSSEQPVERWYGPEILDHSDGCVNLENLERGASVLFGHRTDSVDCVIGHVTKAWVENGRGKAVIQLDDDESTAKVQKKIDSGSLTGVSVGYTIDSVEEVKAGKKSLDGRFEGPCYVAKRWTPYEISIVPVPADSTVGVGRSMDDDADPVGAYEQQIRINENFARALAAGKLR